MGAAGSGGPWPDPPPSRLDDSVLPRWGPVRPRRSGSGRPATAGVWCCEEADARPLSAQWQPPATPTGVLTTVQRGCGRLWRRWQWHSGEWVLVEAMAAGSFDDRYLGRLGRFLSVQQRSVGDGRMRRGCTAFFVIFQRPATRTSGTFWLQDLKKFFAPHQVMVGTEFPSPTCQFAALRPGGLVKLK
ncbi:hypothetical protein OsI_37002 [Oryza sativa Indica Group]|uniref:Uncharacterized protein n=1 Tax=Oryza sativa subsp. indica TaxID=39946 RepID=A2ZGU9_ORYSI|nr:hypothetical protein OsI_37002 [Oryza sativa Indica Group]